MNKTKNKKSTSKKTDEQYLIEARFNELAEKARNKLKKNFPDGIIIDPESKNFLN